MGFTFKVEILNLQVVLLSSTARGDTPAACGDVASLDLKPFLTLTRCTHVRLWWIRCVEGMCANGRLTHPRDRRLEWGEFHSHQIQSLRRLGVSLTPDPLDQELSYFPGPSPEWSLEGSGSLWEGGKPHMGNPQ